MKRFLVAPLIFFSFLSSAQNYSVQLAILHYSGGGDWYNDRTGMRNLANFCNQNFGMNINPDYATVEPSSVDLFNYPMIYMTGHGNFIFTDAEAGNVRDYLMSGGFLFLNDDYGLDPFVRPAMKKVFPELDFVELPFSHPLFHQFYNFPNGVPKIHEHDGKPPQGFGLFYEGRMVAFYDFESDIGDGLEDANVHHDPAELHQKALQFAANLLKYVFQGEEPK